MPKISIEVPHELEKEVATERLKGLMAHVKERYASQISDLQESWDDDGMNFGFKAYSFPVSGKLTVDQTRAHLDANLPMAAMMFKGRFETAFREELQKLFSEKA